MLLGLAMSSCASYADEPPKVANVSNYLIPAAEVPTAEESRIATSIRQEYFNSVE